MARIAVNPRHCAGCRTCQLRCSLRQEGVFIPEKALVTILRLVEKAHEFDISFSGKCDQCGICVEYCPYGALTWGEKESI